MVTAELAVALPALVVVVAAALAGVGAMTDQLRCADAAGTAVRLAARGEPPAMVRSVVARSAPHGAELSLVTSATTVTATVTARLSAPGILARFGSVVTSGRAVAALEPGAGR
jgi:hypothetical protein